MSNGKEKVWGSPKWNVVCSVRLALLDDGPHLVVPTAPHPHTQHLPTFLRLAHVGHAATMANTPWSGARRQLDARESKRWHSCCQPLSTEAVHPRGCAQRPCGKHSQQGSGNKSSGRCPGQFGTADHDALPLIISGSWHGHKGWMSRPRGCN